MVMSSNELVSLLGGGRPPVREQLLAAVRKETHDPEAFRRLVARPAAPADLKPLTEIVGHVNLASMRGDLEKTQMYIDQSLRTLAGELAWQQGLLLLAADVVPLDGGDKELAGTVRLQVGWGGCWQTQALPAVQFSRLPDVGGTRIADVSAERRR